MLVTNPFKPDPRVYKEAKSLAKHGHEVYVVAWDREGKYSEFEEVDGIKIIRTGPKADYGVRVLLKLPLFYLKAFVWVLKLKPNIIHTHDFDTSLLGYFARGFVGSIWIQDIHDLYSKMIAKSGVPRLVTGILWAIEKLVYTFPDALIIVSPKFKWLLRGSQRERSIVIRNVPLSEYDNTLELSVPKGVFYGGVLSSDRGILDVIHVCSELRIPFLIAGIGDESFVRKIRRVAGANFIGYIPRDEYIKLVQKYGIIPIIFDPDSEEENSKYALPNKFFDALCLGAIPLVSRGTYLAELVEFHRIGVSVNYGNRIDLKDKLISIFTNRKLSKKIQIRARKMCQKHFQWCYEEVKLIDLYLRVSQYLGRSSQWK